MEFRILGPMELVRDGAKVAVSGPRRRLLLATLVVHHNTLVPVDRLVDVLFGDRPPERAVGTVQSYVSRLRRDLGTAAPMLETRPGGYVLVVPAVDVDAVLFDRQVTAATGLLAAEPEQAGELITCALGLWRGPALAEFGDDDWLTSERTRLDEVRQRAFEILADARLQVGDHDGAIDLLQRCIADWPLRERFRAQLMLALYRSGRHPEALAAHERFRHVLAEELGLDPSPDLDTLQARMLQRDPSLAGSTTGGGVGAAEGPGGPAGGRGGLAGGRDGLADGRDGPTAAPGSVATEDVAPVSPRAHPGLPLALTTLVGRDRDLSDLAPLLRSSRALTLIGPGGVGKTRLALRLAEIDVDRYPDGVWVCELATIRDPALAVDAITTALDVQRRRGLSALESLVEVLQARDMLVVFDNCEHLLAPVGELAEALLRNCPDLSLLATSREPLAIAGETVHVVQPLQVPPALEVDPAVAGQSAAVALFVDRASSADPGFRFMPADVPAVVEICRRLDGLPLAIELAAARMRSMSPDDVARALDERFRVLTAGRRNEPRHQTLLAAVAWSYDLLEPTEQAIFRRLAVFAGAFTLADVEPVCADGLLDGSDAREGVLALVDKSMVVADTATSPTRYVLLETMRAFGRGQSALHGDHVGLAQRHAAHFVQLAVQTADHLGGPDEGRWADSLDAAFDDLRVAHRWATVQEDPDAALRLVVGLHEFAYRRMRYEVFTWAETTLEQVGQLQGDDPHPLVPLVLAIAAQGRFARGDGDRAMAMAQESLAREEQLGLAPAGVQWRTMGNVLYYRGASAEAARVCQRMLDAARASGDDSRTVHALYMTAVGLASEGRLDDSRELADEALRVAERIDNPTSLASARYAQAIMLEPVDQDRATSMLDRAVTAGRSVGNRWIVAFARTELISLAARRGDLRTALELASGVIETWYRAGDWANQWLTLRHVAGVLALHHDHEDAAVLRGALRVASADLAMPIEASDLRRLDGILGSLPAALGPERMAELEHLGASLTADAVVDHARAALATALRRD